MKRKILPIIVLIVLALSYGIYWAFFDINRLPKDKLLTEVQSPDGMYSIRAYVSESSLSDPAVLGELVYNKKNHKTKNIYWNFKENSAEIKWLDKSTVIINGHTLNVLEDTYDFRRE